MKTCGIALKASDATLCVIDGASGRIDIQHKITLGDDELKSEIEDFMQSYASFIKKHDISLVGLKKRSKTGRYAGGGLTFKMETLMQLGSDVPLHFVSPQALSAFDKKTSPDYPDTLTKDQTPAYLTALYVADKTGSK